ncbi:EscU/YscU/HrcU family type III secretion system export apparatus switch protein [Rhizobium grahamii]|uniref:EscU/YscU/HrcU family type III secretion system export apparatus switch protein n=1 Tax=Rhizobium grahamii TaxID=1120045 RepID=A0A370KHA4_9HYPH|nr:EscU/YscU/HrcU family type III secretion system export apparatus switch protein [Rhizobium grahamii]RDJ04503.1 EscU/YscU/HrcU family type III secretion system export apparatus switch protein [Rhizobium grahamii]
MSNTSEERNRPTTPRKLRDERKKGRLPRTTDFVRAVSTCAGLGYLLSRAGVIENKCHEALVLTDKLQDLPFRIAMRQALIGLTELAIETVGPLFCAVAATAVLATVLAHGGLVISFEPLTPKFENIAPSKGLKRIASLRSTTELGKTLFKTSALSSIFLLLILGMWKTMVYLPVCGMGCLGFVFKDVKLLMLIAAGALLISGLIDLLVQRWLFLRDMRMTTTEVKREQQEEQGKPELKREQRRLRHETASQPSLGLRRSTLILRGRATLAGLRYVRGETAVPVLVCKGEGEAASRMLYEAQALRLSILDDDALARQVIRTTRLGQTVPMQSFEAVARALYAAGLV